MASALTFFSPPRACPYLRERVSQLCYELDPQLTPVAYMTRLRNGWRRFGPLMFRAACRSCAACESLRVPVRTFRPSESQRRAWKRNAGKVQIRIGGPTESQAKLELFARFQRFGHVTKGWDLEEDRGDLGLFVDNPFPTEEWAYYLGERLVGVGYVDALPEGLSGIYFYWDPDEHQRSLGTFNVLAMIDAARVRGLPHVYLGYYVEGCRSLEYKARFKPNEALRRGAWQPFVS